MRRRLDNFVKTTQADGGSEFEKEASSSLGNRNEAAVEGLSGAYLIGILRKVAKCSNSR